MSRTKRNASIGNLLAMMIDIWAEVQKGKLDAEHISIKKYQERHHITKHPRAMILPYITQKCAPTWEQAVKFRKELNEYINKPVIKEQTIVMPKDLFSGNMFESDDTVENAISLLKKNGYIIFKKV